MRYCRYTLQSKISKYASLLLYPTVAVTVLLGGVYCLYCALIMRSGRSFLSFLLVGASIVSFCIVVMLINLSVRCYTLENRKFQITADGLIVQNKHCSFFDWNAIESVIIVAYAASASRQNYQTVVCCMLQPMEKDFPGKILRSYLYGAKNTKKVVIIDYSPAIVEEFTLLYPGNILDLREKQLRCF